LITPWNVHQHRPIDIISMGRVAVDFYSDQIGASLEESETFRKYLGGCAGNIAVGTSRLGLQSAMFSCIGTDAMGQFLKNELTKEGVDITLLKETNQHLTGLVILGVNPPDNFPLIFYRKNCADMELKKSDINIDFFSQAKCLLVTGTGLSSTEMCETTHYAVDAARSVETKIVFDLDYRPVLWGLTNPGNGESRYMLSDLVSNHYQALLQKCDLVVGTEEEILIAGGDESLNLALQKIRKLTVAPIVVKKGKHGCYVYFTDLNEPLISEPYPVEILNVLGAGDGFISGLMRGLLRQESWQTSTSYANACGAILVTKHGCAPAMPSFIEMQQFIKGRYDVRISCPSS
jgi:5-dehydro-2-deoxygluconokinase